MHRHILRRIDCDSPNLTLSSEAAIGYWFLARVERFKTVLFDFSDVPTIGQAFADEIFRVFAASHPKIELVPTRANSEVKGMIDRARSAGSASSSQP